MNNNRNPFTKNEGDRIDNAPKTAVTKLEKSSSKELSFFQKPAFTLAEVLITLGIIGVVAAMTLPNLVGHYRKIEAQSRLKKFYTTMSQAILRSVVDNGEVQYWNKENEQYTNGVSDRVINAQRSYDFFMKYIGPYIKYTSLDKAVEVENPEDLKAYELKVVFSDGSVMYYHNGGCIDMIFDINGNRKPNKVGYDKFVFVLCQEKYRCGLNNTKNFCAYLPTNAPTRAQALALCKTSPHYCSTLLMYDGWEIKEDYPFKL